MNAPRDPWAAFAEVFAEEMSAAVQWTPELIGAVADAVAWNRAELDAMGEEYQREAIVTAQSEAAYAANLKEYNRE